MSIHSVKRSQTHLAWDNSISPVITVDSGDTVTFTCGDASNSQITPTSTTETIRTIVFSQFDPVHGPVYVRSAAPGDVLQVEVLDIETVNWGWTGIIPGFGLLADEFTEPKLKIWDLNTKEGYAWFDEVKGIKIPLKPFSGELGVAPGEKGAFSTIPPYKSGGNIDTKWIGKGTKVFLPVQVEGALVSVGDGHAAQGDGEVCGCAIETSITITLRLTVLKDKKSYVQTPHFRTAPVVAEMDEEYYGTTGVESDIREAARDAVRHMIKFLMSEFGLDRQEAYMLCSVAGDLKLHEVVDMPNYVVGFLIPKSIFTKPGTAFV